MQNKKRQVMPGAEANRKVEQGRDDNRSVTEDHRRYQFLS